MNQQVTDHNGMDDEATVSLGQVIEFLSDEWKRLAAGAAVGLVVGVGGWAVIGGYKAEQILVNQGALTFMSWRGAQQSLPLLAAQLIEQKRVKPDDETMYKAMSSVKWWNKNVLPTYSLTKGDIKDLSISKEMLESGGTNILNLVVTAQGMSKEDALAHVETATAFIKRGAAYLSIKNLVQGWDYQILNTEAALAKKITDTEVDLRYLRQRSTNLEAMRQRFPQNVSVSTQQLVDLKESSAKYMPISTQLVAINTDINNANESLERMRNEIVQIKVMAEFVAQAKPIIDQSADGLAVVSQLLDVTKSIRAETQVADVNANQQLNNIEAELVGVRTTFQRGLDTDLIPQVSRPSIVQPAAGGLVGGVVLMLLVGLGRRAWAAYKAKGA